MQHDFVVVECDQGSEEWHRARAGVITASMASLVRDKLKSGPRKGGYKEAALDYAFRLAMERISGEPLDEGFQTWQMKRGNELEPEARFCHEVRIDMLIERAGFVRTPDGKFGASADGLIGADGGSEYKCLVSPERIRSILLDGDLSEFTDQVQMCMWLTGRQWWHFCLYCPALEPVGKELTIHEVKRDETYIQAMIADLIEFDKLVIEYETKLRSEAA